MYPDIPQEYIYTPHSAPFGTPRYSDKTNDNFLCYQLQQLLCVRAQRVCAPQRRGDGIVSHPVPCRTTPLRCNSGHQFYDVISQGSTAVGIRSGGRLFAVVVVVFSSSSFSSPRKSRRVPRSPEESREARCALPVTRWYGKQE